MLYYYLLGKGGYVFGSVCLFVCLFVCLSVCGQHYSTSYKQIGMKFYGGVLGSTMKNSLNFGGDVGILRWVNEQKTTIIVVAYPDRGAGNDPKLFFFFFEGGSLSPPRLNIFTVGNIGVMICLGQGGLRSLSASSWFCVVPVYDVWNTFQNSIQQHNDYSRQDIGKDRTLEVDRTFVSLLEQF